MIDAIDTVYKILEANGTLFVVDANSPHDKSLAYRSVNEWVIQKTPWGSEIPYFNRDPMTDYDVYDLFGFDWKIGTFNPLPIFEDVKIDQVRYQEYFSHRSRTAHRYYEISEELRDGRD